MIQTRHTVATAIALMLSSNSYSADAGNQAPQEILVFGSNFNLSGTPVTAAEGIVFDTQLELRPVSRTAELTGVTSPQPAQPSSATPTAWIRAWLI